MRIGILSRNVHLYSTKRLVDAGRDRGHQIDVVDTLSVVVDMLGETEPGLVKVLRRRPSIISASAWGMSSQSVRYLPRFDAVVPRIGTTVTEYGLAVVRQFESKGIFCTAPSDGISKSRDKLSSLQLMQSCGIAVPKTAVLQQEASIGVALRAVGGPPAIIKLSQGTQGRGVILVQSVATAVSVYRRLKNSSNQILLQEFLPEAQGKDIRIFVVGDRCVAAMERRAPQGDFRSNLHLGGTAVSYIVDAQLEKIALSACRAHGLHVAGVDIIQSDRGNLVLEVNSSPGLEGIEKVSKKDIAGAIIQLLETQSEPLNSEVDQAPSS